MTTCRKIFTFSWPLRGRGVDPSGQPDRFFPVFFLRMTLRILQKSRGHRTWVGPCQSRLPVKRDRGLRSSWNLFAGGCSQLLMLSWRIQVPIGFIFISGGKMTWNIVNEQVCDICDKILIWERYLAPGPYMCMLNTDPVRSRMGILQVYTNTFIKLWMIEHLTT